MTASVKHMAATVAIAALLAGCATEPKVSPAAPAPLPLLGDVSLDAAAPLIAVTIDGVALHLRVDPGQWEAIELNPEAAKRLPGLTWTADRLMQIGRIALPGRGAVTRLAIEGRTSMVIVAEHGRVAVRDADGVIGPDLLPYAAIRWVRPDAPAADDTLTLPLILSSRTGLAAELALPVPVRLHFSLMRPRSEGTAAAGSFLAQRYGGHFDGEDEPLPVLFGIDRPARPIRFAQPPLLGGFRVARLLIRTSDFRGDNPLPADPKQADEILVAAPDHPQPAESWVTLATDRLSACAEITYRAEPRTLTLACKFREK